MRLEFDARHRDDVFSPLEAMILCDLHVFFRGNVLDADDLADGADAQSLCDLLHHILGRAKKQNPARKGFCNGLAYGGSMPRQYKDGTANRHDAVLLLLCRGSSDHLSILNQDAVVNDGVCAIVSGDPQGAVAFAGTARADKGDNVHSVFPLFISSG